MLGGVTPMPSGPVPEGAMLPAPIPRVSEPMPPPAEVGESRLRAPQVDPIPPAMVVIPSERGVRLKGLRTGPNALPMPGVGRGRKPRASPPAIRYGMKPANPPAYGIGKPPPAGGMVRVVTAP